jgi:hypothetical protein
MKGETKNENSAFTSFDGCKSENMKLELGKIKKLKHKNVGCRILEADTFDES